MKNEFKAIFSKKMLIVSLIAVMLIPVIYSASFLTSMWDPYGKTEELPIAVVNEDQKAVLNGENIDIGTEVVNKLKENDAFEWHFVNAKEAHRGVEKGEFYAAITIPKDFSKNAATLLSNKPNKMNMNVETNPGYSYSGQSIADRSASAVEQAVASQVREMYTKKVFGTVNQLNQGYKDAAAAAFKLNEGAGQLNGAGDQLESGLEALSNQTPPPISGELVKLRQGSIQIGQGIAQLQSGSKSLSDELTAASKNVSAYTFQDKNAELISDPVQVNRETITTVKNYGQSFAPYVIALSLYVGAIAFSTVYPFRTQPSQSKNSLSWWSSKFTVILLQGTLQATLLSVFILKVLEVQVENTPEFLLAVFLISNAWMFLLSFLVAAFDKVGNFLAILLLVLQLGASEGTFPIQLTNGFFQEVHPFSPMTYAIKALRESIFGFEGKVPFQTSLIILLTVFVGMNLLLWMVYHFRFNKISREIPES
jgi:putative membrane protein